MLRMFVEYSITVNAGEFVEMFTKSLANTYTQKVIKIGQRTSHVSAFMVPAIQYVIRGNVSTQERLN